MPKTTPALLAVVFFAALPAAAQFEADEAFFDASGRRGERDGVILTLIDAGRISLAPVSVLELVSGPEQRLGAVTGTAAAVGGGLSFQGNLTVPELAPFVHREIPLLWRIKQPAGRAALGSAPIDVTWETVDHGAGGRDAAQFASGRIQVRPWIQHRSTDRDGYEVIEGGVTLDIPVDALTGGTLRGRIRIDATGI